MYNDVVWLVIQLADFAGGSFTCVMGILMALFERERSVSMLAIVCVYYV